MPVLLEPLFTPEQAAAMVRQLRANGAAWRAGRETSGWHARAVKTNQQLDRGCAVHQPLAGQVHDQLLVHPVLQATAFPRRIHTILFSRSGVGEGYGRHVDNAWMAGGRSDLSFKIWLSDPAAYAGGDLFLESTAGERSYRLPAGHGLVYPSRLQHRVEPVQRGERLVAVGWIESRIRHDEQRELLYELDTARRALHARTGNDEVFDLISCSYSNLLRFWDC